MKKKKKNCREKSKARRLGEPRSTSSSNSEPSRFVFAAAITIEDYRFGEQSSCFNFERKNFHCAIQRERERENGVYKNFFFFFFFGLRRFLTSNLTII